MDVVLRARHTALVKEFVCLATELRIVKTEPGSLYPRSIDAFCTDPRASNFDKLLLAFEDSCAGCAFLRQRDPGEQFAPVV